MSGEGPRRARLYLRPQPTLETLAEQRRRMEELARPRADQLRIALEQQRRFEAEEERLRQLRVADALAQQQQHQARVRQARIDELARRQGRGALLNRQRRIFDGMVAYPDVGAEVPNTDANEAIARNLQEQENAAANNAARAGVAAPGWRPAAAPPPNNMYANVAFQENNLAYNPQRNELMAQIMEEGHLDANQAREIANRHFPPEVHNWQNERAGVAAPGWGPAAAPPAPEARAAAPPAPVARAAAAPPAPVARAAAAAPPEARAAAAAPEARAAAAPLGQALATEFAGATGAVLADAAGHALGLAAFAGRAVSTSISAASRRIFRPLPICPVGRQIPVKITKANRGALRCMLCELIGEDTPRNLYRFIHPKSDGRTYTHTDSQLICIIHLYLYIQSRIQGDDPTCFILAAGENGGCGGHIEPCELGFLREARFVAEEEAAIDDGEIDRVRRGEPRLSGAAVYDMYVRRFFQQETAQNTGPGQRVKDHFNLNKLVKNEPGTFIPMGRANPIPGYRFGMCPVCLLVSQEDEGEGAACLYHVHVCPPEMRNERLYNKYKRDDNKTEFCFTCGRACNGHGHYRKTLPDSLLRPEILPTAPAGTFWNCEGSGGGNRDELIARLMGLINYVNGRVGVVTQNKEFITACSDAAEEAAMNPDILREASESLVTGRFPEINDDIRFTGQPAQRSAIGKAMAAIRMGGEYALLPIFAFLAPRAANWRPVIDRAAVGLVRRLGDIGGVVQDGVGMLCATRRRAEREHDGGKRRSSRKKRSVSRIIKKKTIKRHR